MANDTLAWVDRFWEKVEKRGQDECWLWLGFLNGDGYGAFQRPCDRGIRPDGRRFKNSPGAHRVSYELAFGPIPGKEWVVRHKCDHPPCVNPAHLVLGTRGQNNTERKAKGRNVLDPPREPWIAEHKFKGGDRRQFQPIEDRLLQQIAIDPITSCWIWYGDKFAQGYGRISIRGAQKKTHRVAYEVWAGPIPNGMGILHSCDNRACINPGHLRPGTDKDNTTDRYDRGRSPVGSAHHFSKDKYGRPGESSPTAKLTNRAVALIREGMPLAEASAKYGISQATYYKARSGFSWAHHSTPIPKLPRKSTAIISPEDIAMIRQTNMSTREIRQRFKVSSSTALRAKGATY